MSVSSVASSCTGAYQSQSAKPAAVASNTPVTSDDEVQKKVKSGCNRHGGGQQNTLAKAMMAALKSLGVGQSAATTAAAAPTTAVKTTDTAEKATAVDSGTESRNLEKAVHEFAHELFQALRGSGNSEQEQGQGNGHEHGHGHGHGHHGHRSGHGGGYGRGYGDLAQRIGQLAQTLGAPAGSSTASTAAAAAPVATSTAAVPATATTSTDAVTTSTTTPVASATPATPAVSSNRLLAAFTKLFAALQPKTTSPAAPADTPATDMAAKLKQFLQTLAQSMKPEATSAPTAATGSLLNVTA